MTVHTHIRPPAARRGFSLIELLVVVAIIAALISILLPSLTQARAEGRRALCLTKLREIQRVAIMYSRDNEYTLPRLAFKSPMSGANDQSYSDSLFPYLYGEAGDDDNDGRLDARHYQEHDFFICPSNNLTKSSSYNGQTMDYGMNHYGRQNDTAEMKKRYFHSAHALRTTELANSDAIIFVDADRDTKPEDVGGWSRGNNSQVWPLRLSFDHDAYLRHRLGYNFSRIDGSAAWLPGAEVNFHKWYLRKRYLENNWVN